MSGKINYNKIETQLEELLVLKQAVDTLVKTSMDLQSKHHTKLKDNFDQVTNGVKAKLSKLGFGHRMVDDEDIFEAYEEYSKANNRFEVVFAEMNHKHASS